MSADRPAGEGDGKSALSSAASGREAGSPSGGKPPQTEVNRVLAIDPGRRKCGLAVLDRTVGLVARAVVSRDELPSVVADWCSRYQPVLLLLGRGTGGSDLPALLAGLPVPLRRVPERNTTRLARARYFAAYPPRGWRRLLPVSLQSPPVPVDDFAAWEIAAQFFAAPTVLADG